jgi:hypothetical protein
VGVSGLVGKPTRISGIATLYAVLRYDPFRWTWEEIACEEEIQILLTIWRHKEVCEAMERASKGDREPTPAQNPTGSYVGACGVPEDQLAKVPEERQKKEFTAFCHRTLRIPNTPQGKATIERKWLEGQERAKRMRVAQEAKKEQEKVKAK